MRMEAQYKKRILNDAHGWSRCIRNLKPSAKYTLNEAAIVAEKGHEMVEGEDHKAIDVVLTAPFHFRKVFWHLLVKNLSHWGRNYTASHSGQQQRTGQSMTVLPG